MYHPEVSPMMETIAAEVTAMPRSCLLQKRKMGSRQKCITTNSKAKTRYAMPEMLGVVGPMDLILNCLVTRVISRKQVRACRAMISRRWKGGKLIGLMLMGRILHMFMNLSLVYQKKENLREFEIPVSVQFSEPAYIKENIAS